MSNINIENLSYDMNMDREAMDAISGSGWGWLGSLAKKAVNYVRRNPRKTYKYGRRVIRWIRGWF